MEKCLFRSFSHFLIGLFVFLVLNCMSCLYILEINPMLLFHWQIFSPNLWVVFLFCLLFPLVCKSFFSLSRPHLFNFGFVSIILGDELKKILLQFTSEHVLPMFSSKSFMSSLTFRSLIHLKFVFVYSVR